MPCCRVIGLTQGFRPVLAFLIVALLGACGGREPATSTAGLPAPTDSGRPVPFAALPGWDEDDVSAVLPAWRASCDAFASGGLPGGEGTRFGRPEDWLAACAAAPRPSATLAEARRYFESWFVPVMVADGEQGLITGYYEPEIAGARKRSTAYPVPLYRPPPDLATAGGQARPYHTRAEIDDGALAGRGLEMLWLADPIDAFFLQVQGSGRVRLAGGGEVRVGYAANNGHSYTAIGRILVERGELTKETATMQTVRQWLRDHPDESRPLMQKNARYIFFRELAGDGPVGALGTVLTPGRSLAIDPEQLPLGALLWLETSYPDGTPEAGRPLRRLMAAQDTGAAIKGTVRGDIYWGSGDAALRYAGPMRQQGRFHLLLPAAAADRLGGGL